MVERLRTNFYHFILYQLNHVVEFSLSFVLIAVSTRLLSPEEFGVLRNLQSLAMGLFLVFSLYIPANYISLYYDECKNTHALATLTSTSIFLLIGLGALCVVPSIIAGSHLLNSLGANSPDLWLIISVLIPLSNALTAVSKVSRAYLTQTSANVTINLVTILGSITSFLVALLCLLGFGLKEISFFYAGLSVSVLHAGIECSILSRKKLLIRSFSWKHTKTFLKLSIPTLPLALSTWIYQWSDQIILAVYGGVGLSGKYGLAYKIAGVLDKITLAWYVVVQPILFGYLSEPSPARRQSLHNSLGAGLLVLLSAALGIMFFGDIILRFLAPSEYQLDPLILNILVVAFVFFGVRKYLVAVFWFKKQMLNITLINGIIPAVLNLVLNLILVPLYFEYAAALTTLLAAATSLFLTQIVNARGKIEIFAPHSMLVTLAIVAIGVGVASMFPHPIPLAYSVAIYVTLVGASFVQLIMLSPKDNSTAHEHSNL